MAFKHGKGTVFWLDNSGGSLINLSAFIVSTSMSRSKDVAEVTTFGDNDKEYVAGLRDGTISLEGKWDPTLDAHMNAVLALNTETTQTFEYGPEGGGSGAVKYTGEAHLTSYEPDSPLEDATGWSAELQITGVVTRTTFA